MALPPILQGVINRVRSVWSREQKSIEQATELSKGVAAPMGFDAFSVYGKMGMEPIQDYLRIEQDLMTRYLDVTEMDAYPEISVALDVWADETCQFDVLTGRTVWVESDDLQVKKLLNDLLDSHLEIDEDIWSIARALCKYGNVFEEPLLTQEGVIGLNSLMPETVRRFEKGKGLLVGFAQDPRGVFGITVEDIENVIKGFQSPSPGMQVFEPWEMIHFRLLSRMRPSIYGIGTLEPARWIWRRLLLLEDAALIYRLTRTPTRWIFYIDVGKLPPSQALGQIRRIKNEFAKQKFVNERGCLTGDTCVELLTGEIKTMQELAEAGKEVWVYAYDLKRDRVVPAKARSPRKTAEKVKVWRIVLDSGAVVRCTPDHRFLLRNGTWSEAKDLKPGSSLMPFYLMRGSPGTAGYSKVKHVGLGRWQYVHALVADELLDPNYRFKSLPRPRKEKPKVRYGRYNPVQPDAVKKACKGSFKDVARKPGVHWTTVMKHLKKLGLKPELAVERVENHKVVSVAFDGYEDVYDLTVEGHENFALTAGIFAHNSVDLRFNPLSCLTLDTRIPLLDGRRPTLSEIIREREEGKEHWVYSLDPETKQVVPGRVTQAAVTRRNAELVEVELDNGKKVRCTPDHRFYLRNGTQVEAQYLKAGDSLAPLYRYYWPKNKRVKHEAVVHLDRKQHFEPTHLAQAMHAPEAKTKSAATRRERLKSPVYRQWLSNLQRSAALNSMAKNPELAKLRGALGKQALTAYNKSEEHRQQVAEANRREERWKKAAASVDREKQRKAASKALSATVRKVWKDPEFRAQKSAQVRAMWNEWWEAYRDWEKSNPGGTPKEFRKLFGPLGKTFVYTNHKVVAVRRLEEREDTGCISVARWHNFAIGAYVFVHNSDENLFIPVVDGKRTTEVDLMATPEWQVMDDINYFRDKLFTAIKVPKAFLAAEEAARARLLTLQDLAFARSVMRVQRELRVGIRKICKLHLAALGIDPEKVNFDVYMTIPSWAYELSQLEVRNAKAEFAERVRGYLSERAVMKYIFGFADDEIDAIRSEREEEARRMAELGVEAPPPAKPPRRRGRAEGSTMDLPGASRLLPRDDEHYSEKQFRVLSEQLDEILDADKELASYVDELRKGARDLRSGMFHKSTSGRTRLVHSFGLGNGHRGASA